MIDPGGAVNEYNKYSAKYVPLYRRANGGYFYQQESGLSTELNPDYDPSKNLPVPEAVTKYGVFSATQTASTGKSINAVIQSGGNTTINASTSLNNSVQTVNAPIVTSDSKVDATGTQRATTPFIVHLNSQLPPDLAQQRVDPLTLPGFVIPQGQNGLFRLSTQGTASGAANNGPQSWTMGGASVTPTQRQQTVPVASAVTINRVQGLPASSVQSKPQKYLIETNPVLTDLKQFMSSDYLLSSLGYDPDNSAKRLGDGLFEQRLIQQAVVARTGQRFIDGQTSDEGLFKYLMNNAVASKTELNLSLGVSLTSEQVAALTHDIVWMENAEVNGEQVLVPVLYLAQANNRLAPNGALIAGNDITLIAGKDLNNAGTLRASNNLSATATNDLVNSGLAEAGERLTLKAGNDLTNKAGGIIAGRDVSLSTTRGDVINERTVSSYDDQNGQWSWSQGFADSAARIEAANTLTIDAGRDFNTIGSVVNSRGELTIKAGRDVNIVSAQLANSITDGRDHNDASVTQLGSQVSAGRDMTITAGRDLSAIASQIDAKNDIKMSAVGDLTLASAADEQHSYEKTKTVTKQEDHVSQVSTEITAGGSVALKAGKDLTLISSKVTAGDEAYLVAGDKLELLAAQDRDYTLYDMKKKGGFGAEKTQRDEVTDVKNIGSEITTGGNLNLVSGGDQRYQVAKLESGKDITLDSGGNITFEGVKDLHDESHIKSSNSLAWTSAKGKGNTDETLRQSQLVAQGQLVIKAVDGLKIDIKQIDQKSVSQTIDAMVQADPQLAWLKDAEMRGDVDWQLIKETHESFKYSNSSLGQGAMLVIIIIVTVLTAGAASAAVASASTAMGATAGGTMAAASAATAATATAAATSATAAGLGNVIAAGMLTSMASTAAVSTINNKGNLGAAFKETFSSDSLKNAVIAGATGGFTQGVIDPMLGGHTVPFNNLTKGFDLSTLQGIGGFALHAGAQGIGAGAIKTAINGGSLGQNLKEGLVSQAGNVVAATAFNFVGGYAQEHWQIAKNAGDTAGMAMWAEGGIARTAMHALMGGAVSSATGGDFKSGAIAAGASQALAGVLNATFDAQPELRQAFSQIVGLTAAGLAGGDVEKASWVALMADEYNRQLHQKETVALEELQKESPEKAYELKAAACALVHCAASVPVDDPNYQAIKALETDGQGFKDAQSALFATGAFDEYSKWDQVNDDLLLNDKDLKQSARASRAVLGAIGAAAGFGGAILTTPACVTGLGCAIPAFSGLGGAASFVDGWQATGQLFAPYDYTQGSKVLASFDSATYPGDVNPLRDYGTEAAKAALEITLLKGAGKYLDGTGASVLVSGVKKDGAVVVDGAKATGKLPVPNDLPTNIHAGQQGKHIRGHNNFEEGRSYFNNGVDPAELLGGVHSGKYPIIGAGARGNPIVDFGRPIGIDGRTGQPVTKGQVHYGKNGAHIVPDARN